MNVTGAYGVINIAGPNAQAILSTLTTLNLATEAFPLGHFRETTVANVPTKVIKVSFVSEMAYELHSPMSQVPHIWDALMAAGKDKGLRVFGSDTQRLLRLEMGHAMPGVDTKRAQAFIFTCCH